MKDKTRILIIGDMHCGHVTGLTPPDWWWSDEGEGETRKHIAQYQRWAWKQYCESLDEWRPFDRVLVMGDCIDGKGLRAGSNEEITTDRDEQAEMAAVCIKQARASRIALVYGTPYHTGVDEEWEKAVAREVKAEQIGHKVFIETNGHCIDARHYVGGAQNPKSKATSLLGAQVSNDQWVREYKDHPKADIFIRGHVHRCCVIDEPATLSATIPGLQGWTKFGASRCDLVVHFGIMILDIPRQGRRVCSYRTSELGQWTRKLKW